MSDFPREASKLSIEDLMAYCEMKKDVMRIVWIPSINKFCEDCGQIVESHRLEICPHCGKEIKPRFKRKEKIEPWIAIKHEVFEFYNYIKKYRLRARYEKKDE